MQPEDYIPVKDRIEYHLSKLRETFSGSKVDYHAQELQRVLPKKLVEEIKNRKLNELAEYRF